MPEQCASGLPPDRPVPAPLARNGISASASSLTAPATVAVSVVDLYDYRIPDRIVFPTLAMSLPLIVAVSFVEELPEDAVLEAMSSGAVKHLKKAKKEEEKRRAIGGPVVSSRRA